MRTLIGCVRPYGFHILLKRALNDMERMLGQTEFASNRHAPGMAGDQRWNVKDVKRRPRNIKASIAVLAPQTQALDRVGVTLLASRAKVVEQTPTLADHDQQTATRMKILFMDFQMFGQVGNPRGQNRALYFG